MCDRVVAVFDTAKVSAANSYDVDNQADGTANLNFSWTCQRVTPTGDRTDCTSEQLLGTNSTFFLSNLTLTNGYKYDRPKTIYGNINDNVNDSHFK